MKIFANKNIFKKLILAVLLLLSFSFVSPEPVQAGVGGELMEPICDFVIGLGDGIISALHKFILGQDTTIIPIHIDAFVGEGIVKIIATVLGAILIAALIAVGVGAIGMAFAALAEAVSAVGAGAAAVGSAFVSGFSWTALGTSIAANIGVIIPLALGGGIFGGAKVFSADLWRDNQIDLPLYSISPEEIFTNKIPLFDVNFFNPDPEKKWEYEWAMHLEITDEIKNANYTKLASGTMEEVNKALKKYGTTAEAIKNSNYTDGTNGYYYYATEKNVLRLSAPTAGVAGIGNGEVTVDITNLEVQKGNTSIPSYGMALSKNISKWYYTIRVIAIVGMMSVLVYVGIRILLSSTSSQKAKYKQMLGDWLVGMILLFTMHYIMIFSNMFVEKLTNLLDGINPTIYNAIIQNDKGGKIEETLKKYGYTVTREKAEADPKTVFIGKDEKDGNEYLEWDTNLMGILRIQVREIEQANDSKYIGYTVMFFVMVLYTVIFCWTYIKRVIYLAFLTMIAPMVALTYPIDKANDGKAQGFDYWFKEYMFNLLLQPMHLIIYTVLLSTALELALTNWVYALVAIGFIASAEKIVRTMFNFSKASTPGVFAGPAGAALTMTGIRWLFGHGPGRSGGKSARGSDKAASKDVDGESYTSLKENIDMNAINGLDFGETPTGGTPTEGTPTGGTPTGGTPTGGTLTGEMPTGETPTGEMPTRETTEETPPVISAGSRARRDVRGAYLSGMRKKLSRSIKNANPIGTIGSLASRAALGATFGTIGLAAGIASGDAKTAAQYAGAGIAGGAKLGADGYSNLSSALSVEGLDETYERSYYGEDEYKRRKVKEYNDNLAMEESTIVKYQKAFKNDDGTNISRQEAINRAREDSENYGQPYGMDVDDWIAVRKMQDKEVIDKNGNAITGRTYQKNEAIAARKLHKTVGFEGKKEDDIKKLIKTNFPNVDVDTAYQTIRTYYKTLNE